MNLADLAPARPTGGSVPAPAHASAIRAVVADPAPTSPTDPLYVIRPDVTQRTLMPVRWTQMHGLALPAVGANVLVERDNTGAPYAVWWEGTPEFPAELPPSGPAGGDLAGSYPNPTLAVPPIVVTPWTRVGAAGSGANIAFGTGWTHYDMTTWGPAEYRKVGDEVQMRGAANATTGAALSSILVMAAGWRPGINEGWPGVQGTAAGSYFQLLSTGVLTANAVVLGWIPLAQFRFSTLPRTTS